MAYEEFTAKSRSSLDVAMISILKQGIMGINSACYDKYFKNFKYVVFLYDEENNKIGLKPTNEPFGNAYNVRVSKNGKLANVSAKSFLKFYNISHNESKSYACYWNETEKILEVELK